MTVRRIPHATTEPCFTHMSVTLRLDDETETCKCIKDLANPKVSIGSKATWNSLDRIIALTNQWDAGKCLAPLFNSDITNAAAILAKIKLSNFPGDANTHDIVKRIAKTSSNFAAETKERTAVNNSAA